MIPDSSHITFQTMDSLELKLAFSLKSVTQVYDIFDSVIGIFCQLLTRFDILQAQIASANGFRWYWSKINAYGTLTGHLPEHGKQGKNDRFYCFSFGCSYTTKCQFLVMLSMFKDQNHKFQYFLCLWTSNSGKTGIFGVILTLPKLVSKFEGLKT